MAKNLDKQPLISPAFIWRLSFVVALLLIATIAIYFGGHYFSQSISTGGHTADKTIYKIVINKKQLLIPANTIRYESQRRNGASDRVSLYVSWPGFEGYTYENKTLFNAVGGQSSLIFLDISKSENQMDMSGRFNPIYQNFLVGSANLGPNGLVFYQMDPLSNYKDENLYVENLIKERPFAIKCLADNKDANLNATECLRDVNLGNGLTISYRYSKQLLPHWREIETKILSHMTHITAK